MENVVAAAPRVGTDWTTAGSDRSRLVALGLALAALWFVLCRHLSGEWSINEQYNYGWFVPFFAAYLFWLRWEDRPRPRPEIGYQRTDFSTRNSQHRPPSDFGSLTSSLLLSTFTFLLLALLLPVRLFEVANPDWRPLGWLHAAAVVGITLTAIWWIGGPRWLGHFAFPVAFIFVAVPWLSVMEEPIVQGLMRGVAVAAAETMSLCGVPAQVQGNLIQVATGVVGVNEACSGVRSLQTSLMIGLLFGELKRLSVLRRVLLVLGALAVALTANFFRALFLVSVAARENVAAVGRWHDLAGYSIVAVVFLASIALAALLGRGKVEGSETRRAKVESRRSGETVTSDLGPPTSDLRPPFPVFSFRLSPFYFLLSLLWLVALELGVETWYRVHERDVSPALRWSIRWPENSPGFRDLPIEEGVRATLRYDEGREVVWNSPSPVSAESRSIPRCFLFFFRWNPGGSSVARARAHRPDICLPSSGWRQIADGGVRSFAIDGQISLPFRRIEFVSRNGATAHTFFCLQEDRRTHEARPDLALPPGMQPDWSFPARWQAVRDGVRNMGQQVMEFVILAPSNVSTSEADSRFAAMLPELVESRK